MCHNLGGKVEEATEGEYGRAKITVVKDDAHLFQGLSKESDAWMSHRDKVTVLPEGCASSSPVVAPARGSPPCTPDSHHACRVPNSDAISR